jgi:1-aminocyclopropane-1-carboxylate deaminase
LNTEVFYIGNSELQPLRAPCLGRLENVFIKRDDLIHPVVSGNKWRKLKYHVEAMRAAGKSSLVTFGGAYSNHMVAAACVAATYRFRSSCFVRGQEILGDMNHYLRLARLYGMNFIPVEREMYRMDKRDLYELFCGLDKRSYFVDEGGAGPLGAKGVAEIIDELPFVPDFLYHASATGTTAEGLIMGTAKRSEFVNMTVRSVAVLKNAEEQRMKIEAAVGHAQRELLEGFEVGGYAKTSPELMQFVKQFIRETGILIDPVYTGKALWALKMDIASGRISDYDKVIFLHTGGMLGLFSEKMMGEM